MSLLSKNQYETPTMTKIERGIKSTCKGFKQIDGPTDCRLSCYNCIWQADKEGEDSAELLVVCTMPECSHIIYSSFNGGY